MMVVTEGMKKFIVRWGEMGTLWGINRTVAQIHGLLFISPRALNAEEISDILMIARSNVSNSLKELKSWGIVKVVHKFGDRKEYFESLKDVWKVTSLILDQRKRREIDPTIGILNECLEQCQNDNSKDDHYSKVKMKELLEFFQSMTVWYGKVRKLPMRKVFKLVNMGQNIKLGKKK